MNETKNIRYLSRISIWALSFGCVIGWGAFVMPGNRFLPDAGPVGTILGVTIAAIMILIICYNYAQLSRTYPEAAGSYFYTRNILGEDHAFLAVWSLELAYISLFWANATAFILVGRSLFGNVLEKGFHYQIAGYDIYFGEVITTLLIIWFFGLITCFGKKAANFLRTVFAIILFVSIVTLFFEIMLKTGGKGMLTPAFSRNEHPAMQVLSIVVLAPWLFVGFETVAHSVPESKTRVPKMFFMAALAIVTGMIVYIMLTLVGTAAAPEGISDWSEYVENINRLDEMSSIPVIHNSYMLLGKRGLYIIGIATFSALTTSVMGFHRAASRIIRIMAEGKLLPEKFAVSDQNGVPVRASLAVLIISTPIPFIGQTAISWNADVSTLSVAIVYIYISVCAYQIGKRDSNGKKVRITGMLGIASSALIIFCLLVPNVFSENVLVKESYLMLALWSLIGIIYYRYVFRHDTEHRFGKSTIMWLMMLFVLFFSANVWSRMNLQDIITDTFGENSRAADSAIIISSIVQLAIIVVALILIFGLFRLMLKREKEMGLKVVRAEEKNKAKTDFLFNMSHDIRTPMNAIIGFTDLALLDSGDPGKTKGYLEQIKTSGTHLLSLINDILEMSRIENGRIDLKNEPVNLKRLLDEISSIVRGQAEEKNHKIIFDAEHIASPNVLADRLRLDQMLLNLISNAIKYTPDGGEIHVSIKQPGVEAAGKADYQFAVKDNGIGMTQEFAEKVFEAFERERNSTISGIQGTGLGMAITKRIVDIMGGEISVNTAPGAGTEFIISVKLETTGDVLEKSTEHSGGTDETVLSFEGKRVLLVDDMEVNRSLAKAMLEMNGFIVEEAADGHAAVEMVAMAAPAYYDVVLMDIQMPRMNGYEASRAIRNLSDERKRMIPIVAVTANAFDEDIKNALDAGMNGHIAKPIDMDMMMETLRNLIFS